MGGMRFEDLEVWKLSARLSCELYQATRALKDWGYRDQLTRAGLSISSNIAEGYERESNLECIRFLSFAKGSCGEVRSQLYVGKKIEYLDAKAASAWIEESEVISKMLASLIRKRKQFNQQAKEEPGDYGIETNPQNPRRFDP